MLTKACTAAQSSVKADDLESLYLASFISATLGTSCKVCGVVCVRVCVCVCVCVCDVCVCERVSALLCLVQVETPPPEWVRSMTGLTNMQCHIKVTPLSTRTGPTHQSGRDQAELIAGVQSYSTNCFVHS